MSRPQSKKAKLDQSIALYKNKVKGPDEVLRHVRKLADQLKRHPVAERTLAELNLPHNVRYIQRSA